MARSRLSAVPAVRSTAKSLRVKQNIIISSVVAAALLGPAAMLITLSDRGNTPVAPYEVPSSTIAFADWIANDYLAGVPTQLPAAEGVSQTFGFRTASTGFDFVSYTYNRSLTTSVGGRRVDLVRFDVDTGNELLLLTVTVSYDGNGKPLLAATPSFAPSDTARNGDVQVPRPTAAQGVTDDIPRLVSERVTLWADAYAADDTQALKVLVNDDQAPAGSSYKGLGGFTCPDGCARVLWAAPSVTFEGFAIARVAVGFRSSGANEFEMNSEFDLLVKGWRTDAPRVQAWGPAGSGSLLRPYMNTTDSFR